jgi:hypothetical protein
MSRCPNLTGRAYARSAGDKTSSVFEDAAEEGTERRQRSCKDADVEFDAVPDEVAVVTSRVWI